MGGAGDLSGDRGRECRKRHPSPVRWVGRGGEKGWGPRFLRPRPPRNELYTWEPSEHLERTQELVEDFHRENPDMPRLCYVVLYAKVFLPWPSKRRRFFTLPCRVTNKFNVHYVLLRIYYYIRDLRTNPYEAGANITLGGIAYLIIKSEVYGFIEWPYIQTYAPEVMSFQEASGRRLGLLEGSTFRDLFNWLGRCLANTTPLIF